VEAGISTSSGPESLLLIDSYEPGRTPRRPEEVLLGRPLVAGRLAAPFRGPTHTDRASRITRPDVLGIEDDPDCCELLTQLLDSVGSAVAATDSVFGSMAQGRCLRPHTSLVDLGLPHRTGPSLLADPQAYPRTSDAPARVGSDPTATLTPGRQASATGIFAKSLDLRALPDAFRATCATPGRTRDESRA
jgi:CheY-like chemotaxis protein